MTAIIAVSGPSWTAPVLDVAHDILTVECGERPSGRADLFLPGKVSPAHAWPLGLRYLQLTGTDDARSDGLIWLGSGTVPPMAPLLTALQKAGAEAVVSDAGILVHRAALVGVQGAITAASLRTAGLRVVRAPAAAPPMLEWIQRPFTRADLASVPSDWQVGPPDFIGVGCGKAGSSWWYDLLRQHPDVVPNRLRSKELHFLCHFDYRGPSADDVATYRQAFARPAGRLCGEWSGNLMQHPMALTYMAMAAPEARLIALIRNPIDRSVSAYNQFLQHRAPFMGVSGARRRVLENFSLFPEAMLASRLARAFHEILRSYPRDRLLVLQYEACRADPAAALRQTWQFLGLRPVPLPADIRRPVNVQPYRVPRPEPDQRARMAAWFQDDVDAVMALFPQLDRRLWPDFA